jgi:hypothetical protein
MGGGGAQRPVGRDKEPKKTGARSARARTRGQNPLVTKEAFKQTGTGTYLLKYFFLLDEVEYD